MKDRFVLAKIGGSKGPADLIFVHGLTGDLESTWTCSADGTDGNYWPKWICADVLGLNVYALNYPSSLLETWAKKEMSLYERGKATLEYLAGLGFGTRPLGFVAHSLGGLLVKQVVKTGFGAEDRGWNDIAKKTRFIAFLGTPHTGASVASVVAFALPRLSSKYVRLLSADSSELDQLNAEYRRIASAQGIRTVAYYEMHKAKRLAVLVGRVAADPGVGGTELIPVDADHIAICKPASRHDAFYTGILRHISLFAQEATASTPGTVIAPSQVGSHKLTTFVYAEDVAHEIYFVLPLDNGTIFSIPIKLVMANATGTGVKNVYLHLELSDSLYAHGFERTVDKFSAAREIRIVTDKGRTENIAKVLYKIPYISPRMTVSLSDYLFVKDPTTFVVKTPLSLKDGDAVVSTRVVVEFPITVTIDGEDVLPSCFNITVHVRKGDIEDFVAVKREENQLIKQQHVPSTPRRVTFIGFKKFSQRPVDGLTTRVMDAQADSMVAINARITPRGVEPAGTPKGPI